MTRVILAAMISAAVAACATAAATVGFPAADADDNDVLSQAEFNEFFDDTDLFERFDDNDDLVLSRTEYNEAVDDAYETDAHFGGLDKDASGTLSRDEFLTGWFAMFDADKNGSLSRGEFENSVGALEPEI